MGGLEGSQRLLPTSSGLEQGGELSGAESRTESQDSEGEGAHLASRVWGGRKGIALCPVRGVRVLPDGAGRRLHPPPHGGKQADDTSGPAVDRDWGQRRHSGPSKGAARPNLNLKNTVCLRKPDSRVRSQFSGVLGLSLSQGLMGRLVRKHGLKRGSGPPPPPFAS